MIPPQPSRTIKSLLPLGDVAREPGARTYTGQPEVVFKPRGLMIWNAPDDAQVVHVLIGNQRQLVASVGPLPAKWFAIAQSYEQVWQMQQKGLEPPGWGDFDTVTVGMLVRVRILSPNDVKLSSAAAIAGFEGGASIADRELASLVYRSGHLDRIQVAMWGESLDLLPLR